MVERLGPINRIRANLAQKMWDLLFGGTFYSKEGTIIEDSTLLSLDEIKDILGANEEDKSVGNRSSTS